MSVQVVVLFATVAAVVGQVCLSNYDCPSGHECLVDSASGVRKCSEPTVGHGVQPQMNPITQCYSNKDCAINQYCRIKPNGDQVCEVPQTVYCLSNRDCPSGETCVIQNDRSTVCQLRVGGNVGRQPQVIYCTRDRECPSGETCVLQQDRSSICQLTVGGNIGQKNYHYCNTDRDCQKGETCALQQDRSTVCQVTVGGNIGSQRGVMDAPCDRDSDCADNLRCVNYYGELICRKVDEGSIPPSEACEGSRDCRPDQVCRYRPSVGTKVCLAMGVEDFATQPVMTTGAPTVSVGGYVVPPTLSVGGNIGNAVSEFGRETNQPETQPEILASQDTRAKTFENSTDNQGKTIVPTYDVMSPPRIVEKRILIDPAAMPCEFDYQCRMGESCSGFIPMVDRNVTVCQYDVTKKNRLCIYHADCLQGQKCEKNATGSFVCTASLEAALGNLSCFYDYECSGGEKCTNVGDDKNKKFRCRKSDFPDPRKNQKCRSNAECPYQQVCRHISDVTMCVDIESTVANSSGHEIQKKLVDFVRNLLFSKV